MSLSDNLKRLRYDKRVSQVQLSKLSKVSRFTIANIEADKTDPAQSTLQKLSDALGVKITDLLGDMPPVREAPAIAKNKTNGAASRLEARISELEKEMIRGFARLELLIQTKK